MTGDAPNPKDGGRMNRLGPDPKAAKRSTTKGDVPEAMLDRYLIERDRSGRPERFFRDHRSNGPLFRDRGSSLVSDQAYPDAVIDMLKIARHRGWERIRVSGDEAFRREVWIQAQSLGLQVAGHRPRERDRQAAGLPPPEQTAARPDMGDRLAKAAIVVRRLITDPEAQVRLLDAALARAGKARQDRPRDRERPR